MSPLPGPPPGNAHPGRPSAARRCLPALLLAVLALVGGAPAGAGAGATGLPVSATAAHPATTATPTLPATTAPRLPVPQATAERSATPDATDAPRTAPPLPPPATADRGPDSTPWVAAEHPRTAHQLPPPGPGGLVLRPARAPLPRSVPWSVRTAPASAVQRPRVALPGVRGPPGARIPVPQSINAVPFPPS